MGWRFQANALIEQEFELTSDISPVKRRFRHRGKVQEEGSTPAARPASGGRWRNEGYREKPKRVLPARFSDAKKEAASSPPLSAIELRPLSWPWKRLGFRLCPGLGCELLLDLGRDGFGINLVQSGGVPKHIRSVVT